MKKQSQGFTLIELMIVIAIIGILATIAIPQYQNYLIRSQVSESISMMSAAVTMVDDDVMNTGSFPSNRAALINLDVQVAGTYGSISGVSTPIADSGTLVYKLSSHNINKKIHDGSIWFSREADTGIWSCQSNILLKYLPKICIESNSIPVGL